VTLGDTMASLCSFSPGQSFVVLAPEHVQILAGTGDQASLKEDLYPGATTRADSSAGQAGGAIDAGRRDAVVHRGRAR